ncbi:aminotransferase class I/II-fold pyridoxal phosphate-dependent enzyme [Spirosoma sp. HMF4905]|uniref:Aminotransferase class I/II-fold pyridoxal phosphate-dependent enzyme n=1 Tax=Spirosoma arboris TaxID=2682092 RepID=A0A7K1S8K4_9BACT|nr:DegT/DnrJ/EryC1/StrS family aminotransferase [Spirosoma arboris]MVM30119.1 aminotransferase class I/II-fold pyridoxal phosphate-dependent enzyme [Spirosoma arboris]
MINVTKSYLPDLEDYVTLLRGVWERVHLTNDGPLLRELEAQLKEYLGVKHLKFCTNGTIVLQMALKALDIKKEVITTPFSYVATTNALLWEGCTPIFADIRPDDFNIDPAKIESLITENTQAIMATHVYGNACQIEQIQAIAEKYNLKVIYDAAHTFGATYKGNSILSYGDVSTCSFHATKVFHTVEGGCIVTNDDALAEKLHHYRSFGHKNDTYFGLGINAKNSEFHAAMGLCVLPKVPDLIAARKLRFGYYDNRLDFTRITRPSLTPGVAYNYAYYPVVFDSEETLLRVMETLVAQNIVPRRYFYPSLNTLPFALKSEIAQPCPISEDVALRVLCLPMYPDLAEEDIDRIATLVNEAVVAISEDV